MAKVGVSAAARFGAPPRGDERRARALDALVEAAADRGLRIATDLLGDRAEAEDAVQEALARTCEALDRIREPQALPAWFFRVLTRVCLRSLRRRRLRRLVYGAWRSGQRPEAGRTADSMARSEEIRALLSGLEELSTRQRAALVLRYGHELPVAEVAHMLGVEEETAKTHIARGLRGLRKSLRRRLGGDR